MTGIAVGQMGLSLETFLGLTPQQFNEIYNRFMERIEADDILAERRIRMLAFTIVRPPSPKKRITVYDLWEIKGDKEIKAAIQKKQKPSTRGRFEELKNKWQ